MGQSMAQCLAGSGRGLCKWEPESQCFGVTAGPMMLWAKGMGRLLAPWGSLPFIPAIESAGCGLLWGRHLRLFLDTTGPFSSHLVPTVAPIIL